MKTKKFLMGILFLILVLSFSVVSAKGSLSVGADLTTGPSSIDEATTAYNYSNKMGYTSELLTSPTFYNLGNSINTFNSNGGGILFFLGHGGSDMISWNYTGISRVSGIDDLAHPIQEFALNKVDMAIFMGCQTTANLNTNLPKTAYNNGAGAKRTIGWDYDIYDEDTGIWVDRFYVKLYNGGTFLDAINYANNYSYTHNKNMKSVHYWGRYNSGIAATSVEKSAKILGIDIGEVEEDDYIIYSFSENIELNRDSIASYIQSSFDKDFDVDNYTYELTEDEIQNQRIHDYNLLIDGAKTNVGYTVFEQDGKIKIYNHMNEKSNLNITNNTKNSFDEEKAIAEALKKNEVHSDKIRISLESTLKSYDINKNKKYFEVNLEYLNLENNTRSIITEKFEI